MPALMFRMGIILIYGMTRGCLCKGAFMCPPLLLLTAQLQKLWTFLMSSILNVVDCKVIEKIHFNCCPGKDKWVWQIGEVQCQFSLQRSVETRFDFTPPPPPTLFFIFAVYSTMESDMGAFLSAQTPSFFVESVR